MTRVTLERAPCAARRLGLGVAIALSLLGCAGEGGAGARDSGAQADASLDATEGRPDSVPLDTASDPLPDPGSLTLHGACPSATRYGGFVVKAEPAYTYAQGEVADGVVPGGVGVERLREGGCVFIERQSPHCSPSCTGDTTCDRAGRCVPYPTPRSLGEVTIEGLLAAVAMRPAAPPGANYFDTSLPHPAMTPGATVRLRAAGDFWPGMTLFGVGVAPLTLPEGGRWEVARGRPLEVSWQADPGSAPARIRLSLNIDQHGLSPVTMSCLFDDTGHGQVPASIIDALMDAGVTGYPSGTLSRRSADSVAIGEGGGGCVDFIVESTLSSGGAFGIDVAGYVPCNSSADCPGGGSCDEAQGLCR